MYMGCCEKNINHMYTYLYLGGADLTIYYFIRGRFDQVILFWGPICRGPTRPEVPGPCPHWSVTKRKTSVS